MEDKKPQRKKKFTYTLIKRYAVLGTTETASGHKYLSCLDKLDLGLGKEPAIYLAKYSMEYVDYCGNKKFIKGFELSLEELQNLAAALQSL